MNDKNVVCIYIYTYLLIELAPQKEWNFAIWNNIHGLVGIKLSEISQMVKRNIMF